MDTCRHFLRAALVLALALSWASQAFAAAPKHPEQAPGFFRLKLGDVEVTALYDGAGLVKPAMLHGAAPEQLDALLLDAGLDPKVGEPIAINAFLLNTGASLILVDAGGGTALGPRAGQLPANLRAAGYEPGQVDVVLLTHMHGDHALGLLGPDNKPLYPNAVIRPAVAEAAYWLADATLAAAPEARKASIQGLRKMAEAYTALGKWKPFGPDEAPAEGVTAEKLPGHTPGQTGFWVRSQGQSLFFFGDTIHSSAVQFARPEVTIDYDSDQAGAKAARLALLSRLAKESCWVAGTHLQFPGIGRMKAQGKGYVWLPVRYTAPRD